MFPTTYLELTDSSNTNATLDFQQGVESKQVRYVPEITSKHFKAKSDITLEYYKCRPLNNNNTIGLD